MSRTIRKSYFDYSNQSFQKYYDKEIREWTNSKNKKVWIKNKLKHCENIDQVKNVLNKCYKMSKTDNIFSFLWLWADKWACGIMGTSYLDA